MSAWDDLLDHVDRLVDAQASIDDEVEADLVELVGAAQLDGTADRELDTADAGRWLAALLRARADVQAAGERRDDDALSTLRVIITRWLHPGRLDQTPPTFGH